MLGLGSIINAVTILVGSFLGKIAGGRLPERVIKTVMSAMGLFIIFQGVQMALETNNALIVLISVVIGTIIGSVIDIEARLDKLGDKIKQRFKNQNDSTFTQAFVAATVMYCVGPMAIMGAISDGMTGDISILITKSILDGISSIAFTTTMGVGVAFSAILVLLYQGLISVFAGGIAPIITAPVIAELTAAGGIILMATGFNIVVNAKIRTGNMLPAIFFAIILASFAF